MSSAQIVAGDRHTLARTAEGRVLGFGANNYGQLGLGSSLSFASIPAPTEIPMARAFPKTTRLNVERIAAGGNVSYFVVESEDISNSRKTISLLAVSLPNSCLFPFSLINSLTQHERIDWTWSTWFYRECELVSRCESDSSEDDQWIA